MVGSEIEIRPATLADVPDLVRLRRVMFQAVTWDGPADMDGATRASEEHLRTAIPAGTFRGWVAVTPAGEVVATGGLIIDHHLPTPRNLSGQVAYILNVVTDPAYRRQGLARRIVQTMLDWTARQQIARVTLNASEHGRRLYASMGFQPTGNAMRMEIEK